MSRNMRWMRLVVSLPNTSTVERNFEHEEEERVEIPSNNIE